MNDQEQFNSSQNQQGAAHRNSAQGVINFIDTTKLPSLAPNSRRNSRIIPMNSTMPVNSQLSVQIDATEPNGSQNISQQPYDIQPMKYTDDSTKLPVINQVQANDRLETGHFSRPGSSNKTTRPHMQSGYSRSQLGGGGGEDQNGDDEDLDEEDGYIQENEDALQESLIESAVLEEVQKSIRRAQLHEETSKKWPASIDDDYVTLSDGSEVPWPQLDGVPDEDVQKWISTNKKVLIRTVTWNLQAKRPPPVEDVQVRMLPPNKFHLYFVGSEECERSIAKSVMNTSKKNWEAYLLSALGSNYMGVCSHTLQAIHLMVFAHRALVPFISEVVSGAIATGIANTLGNKGGIAISMRLGNTKLIVLNCHLAAHHNAVSERNDQMNRIDRDMTTLLFKKTNSNGLASGTNTPFNTGGMKGANTPFNNSSSAPRGSVTPFNNNTVVMSKPTSSTMGGGPNPFNSSSMPTRSSGSGNDQPAADATDSAGNTLRSQSSAAPEFALHSPPGANRQFYSVPSSPKAVLNGMPNPTELGLLTPKPPMAPPPTDSRAFVQSGARGAPMSISMSASASAPVSVNATPDPRLAAPTVGGRTLAESADAVVIMGDLNYRIRGNRALLDELLSLNIIDQLKKNDQLKWSMDMGYVFKGYKEHNILFRPTYKFDKGRDTYDSGPKKRIPGWTDRILYSTPSAIECHSYNSETNVRTSDHRPVYATFALNLNIEGIDGFSMSGDLQDFQASSTSQVCSIM